MPLDPSDNEEILKAYEALMLGMAASARERRAGNAVRKGVWWIALGAVIVISVVTLAFWLRGPSWLLLTLVALVGWLFIHDGIGFLEWAKWQRGAVRAREPFRSVALGVVLKAVGVGVLFVAYFVPRPMFFVLFQGGHFPEWMTALGAAFPSSMTGWAHYIHIWRRHELLGFQLVVFGTLGGTLVHYGYRLSLKLGTGLLTNDRRAPILYLRSFDDDGRYNLNPVGLISATCGLRPMGSSMLGQLLNFHPLRIFRLLIGTSCDTAEEQMAYYFRKLGPVIAIGRPGESVAVGGAARIYVDHNVWQERVLQVLQRAQIVILQPAKDRMAEFLVREDKIDDSSKRSDGIWWEIEQCIQRVAPGKLILCLAALSDSEAGYELFRRRINKLLNGEMPPKLGKVLFVTFTGDWKPVPIEPCYRPWLAWPFTGLAVDFRTMFWTTLTSLYPETFKVPVRVHRFRLQMLSAVALLAALAIWEGFVRVPVEMYFDTVGALCEAGYGETKTYVGSPVPYHWDLPMRWRPEVRNIDGDLFVHTVEGLDGTYVGLTCYRPPMSLEELSAQELQRWHRTGAAEPRILTRSEVESDGYRRLDIEADIPASNGFRDIVYYRIYSGAKVALELEIRDRAWSHKLFPWESSTIWCVLDRFHPPDAKGLSENDSR